MTWRVSSPPGDLVESEACTLHVEIHSGWFWMWNLQYKNGLDIEHFSQCKCVT